MLKINKEYIENNGGILHAIRKKSNRYIKALLERDQCIKPQDMDFGKLDRTIVHKAPHLDEYFADLIFRSAIPDHKMDIDFMEMSIHSKNDDLNCKAYWPNATVMGIGGGVSGGVSPLLLFDEHLDRGRRSDASCSQMVVNHILHPGLPLSIAQVLKEVNEIDSSAGAHDHHIGNIMKTAHDVRLLISQKEGSIDSTNEWMDSEWKKTIIDSCITSIIYSLEHNINLRDFRSEMDHTLRKSLSHYIHYCGYQSDDFFKVTMDRITNTFHNQHVVFKDAVLPKSTQRPQLLIIGRICYTLEMCWGKEIADIIMMHIWEIIYQSQYSFQQLKSELKPYQFNDGSFKNAFGAFEKRTISVLNGRKKEKIWLFKIDQKPNLIKGNRAINNFIKRKNKGKGIILVEDNFQCTKAIFKSPGIDDEIWTIFVDIINTLEPGFWHAGHSDNGNYVPFILNGNPSHRYLEQSAISLDIIENIFNNILSS